MVKNKRLEKEQITTASIKKLISVLQSGAINYEQYQQELQMQLDKMSEANKAYLSQYVTHRKVVLELLRFVLQSENFGTQFYLYAVCNLIPKLRELAFDMDMMDTPDKKGMYKYHKNRNAHIKILSYDKMLNDAENRNNHKY